LALPGGRHPHTDWIGQVEPEVKNVNEVHSAVIVHVPTLAIIADPVAICIGLKRIGNRGAVIIDRQNPVAVGVDGYGEQTKIGAPIIINHVAIVTFLTAAQLQYSVPAGVGIDRTNPAPALILDCAYVEVVAGRPVGLV